MKNNKNDDYSQRFIELIIKERDYGLSKEERLELKEKSLKTIEKINWHLKDYFDEHEQPTPHDLIPPAVADSPLTANPFANLLQKKLKVEETHTRMTFLVRNELAEEFNALMDKVNRKRKKKEFINTMMEQAIIQLREAIS